MAGRPNLYRANLLSIMYQFMIPSTAKTLLNAIGGSKRTLYYNLKEAINDGLIEIVARKSNKSEYKLTSLGEKVHRFQLEAKVYKQS